MKISLRILLINFIIVVLIVGSAALAFYSIMYEVLASQQSRYLISSANNFIFIYRSEFLSIEDEFLSLSPTEISRAFYSQKIPKSKIDFILESKAGDESTFIGKVSNEKVHIPEKKFGINEFKEYNPLALIFEYSPESGEKFYYGRILTNELLDVLAKGINSEIALMWKGSPLEISNESINQKYLYILTKANEYLSAKRNIDIYSEGAEQGRY